LSDSHARPDTLDDWLSRQLAAHPTEIELGLTRVAKVADALDVRRPAAQSLVIGGTNGKGSCVALASGLIGPRARVGCYTSPHLWRYNERVTIDGQPVSDGALVDAFEAIEAARGDTSLTFFEWGTLAALWLFKRHAVDVAVLEVGLGGRLDAVNIVDADVALVVSIGLDHTDWLGDTREAIGAEKAGIFRRDRAALCGERDRPASLAAQAHAHGARFESIGDDFDITASGDTWQIRAGDWRLDVAAPQAVYADNLAASVVAVRRLGFDITADDVARSALAQQRLPGRREWQATRPAIVYDVGHNAAAIELLAQDLADRAFDAVHLVIGMLADKPVEAISARLAEQVDCWYPVDLSEVTPRGLTAEALAGRLGLDSGRPIYGSPAAGLAAARASAGAADCVVVCGSFYTVAQLRDPKHE
tara:strand:+ start:3863 stop:5119 length:1257 start_codon:yes stop_codon:yes gene_type:complete